MPVANDTTGSRESDFQRKGGGGGEWANISGSPRLSILCPRPV